MKRSKFLIALGAMIAVPFVLLAKSQKGHSFVIASDSMPLKKLDTLIRFHGYKEEYLIVESVEHLKDFDGYKDCFKVKFFEIKNIVGEITYPLKRTEFTKGRAYFTLDKKTFVCMKNSNEFGVAVLKQANPGHGVLNEINKIISEL